MWLAAKHSPYSVGELLALEDGSVEPDPEAAFVLAAAAKEEDRVTERWNRVVKGLNNVVKVIKKLGGG